MTTNEGSTGDAAAHWGAVSRAINQRMKEFGWDQADLVRRAGVSDPTVRHLQRGTKSQYRRSSLRKVSVALLWPPDGIERLAEGATVEDLERQLSAVARDSERASWRRVASAIAARRESIGDSPHEVAAAARVPLDVVEALEDGERTSYPLDALARVASALDWPADAVHQLLVGEPEPRGPGLSEIVTNERLAKVECDVADIQAAVDEIRKVVATLAQSVSGQPPKAPGDPS